MVDKSEQKSRGGKWTEWMERIYKDDDDRDYVKRRLKRQLMEKKDSSSSQYRKRIFDGQKLKTIKDIKTQDACNDECLNHPDCILFMFSPNDNDLFKADTCQLFGKNTRLKESNKNINGVVRGETNCTEGLKDCTLSQELKCEGIS